MPTDRPLQLLASVRVSVLPEKFTVAWIGSAPRNCTSVRSAIASASSCGVVKPVGGGGRLISTLPAFWPTLPWFAFSVTVPCVKMFGSLTTGVWLVTSLISPWLMP